MILDRTRRPRCLHHVSLILIALACSALPTAASAGLRDYVQRPEAAYSYKLVKTQSLAGVTAYQLHLTSQEWHGTTWHHWLSILVPKHITHPDKAVLLIAGGSNKNHPPKIDPSEMWVNLMASIVNQSQAIFAVVQQVPNEPLFNDLSEDGLIAYSFKQYLDTGDATWPLLLPMVKSAVKAMDAVTAFSNDKFKTNIHQFIVTGASKRGWTTWLTAATDPRVIAIAPMVIDMLNLQPQMRQQQMTYGRFSQQIEDYSKLGISQVFATKAGRQLMDIVDPFAYLHALTMPKLIFLGTNDPYWTVDAANLYFSELPGLKHLFYYPNAGHDLGIGVIPELTAFVKTILSGNRLPKVHWRHPDDRSLAVTWSDPTGKATLWQAHSDTRDFRQAHWTPTPLTGSQQCKVSPAAPDKGYLAYFVQVRFSPKEMPSYVLSTQMTVLPHTFPYPPPKAK